MIKSRSKLVLVAILILGLLTFMTACDSDTTEKTGPVVEEMTVQVTVLDESTEEPVDGVAISLTDENNTLEETTSEGAVTLTAELIEGESYTISAQKDGYVNTEKEFTAEADGDIMVDITMTAEDSELEPTTADVASLSELETALGDQNIETINLKADITGDFTVLREVVINGGEYTLDGNPIFGDGSETLDITLNNATVTGVLTVDVLEGSVYLTDVVIEEIVVDSVGSHSLNISGNSSVNNLIANGSGRITGGRMIQNALINAPINFDRPPQNVDEDSTEQPEYEDASRFSLASPGEQEINTPFSLNINAAFDEDNVQLDGDYSVSVTSDIEGSLSSGTVTFTEGKASVELSLTEAGSHQLTVEVGPVTGSETTNVEAVLPPAEQPDSLNITSQPNKARVGENISAAVKAVDEHGRGVAGAAVTASLNFGSFDSGETTVTTDENGVANFSGLVLTTSRKGYEITFNTEGAEAVVSNPFEVQAGFADASNSSVEYGGSLAAEVNPKNINANTQVVSRRLLKAGTVGRVTFTFRDKYNNTIRDTRYVSISTLESELRLAKSISETAKLTGEFSLNEDMSGAVTDPSELVARSNNDGQVSIYFRSTYAPGGEMVSKDSLGEVEAALISSYSNIGRISALIDGERISSDNLQVIPAEPAVMEVFSSYDSSNGKLILNIDRLEDEFGNNTGGEIYRIYSDESTIEFSDGKNTESFSLNTISNWEQSELPAIDINDFKANFESFDPANFDGTEYIKIEFVGDSSSPYVFVGDSRSSYVMDWSVETTVDYPVEFVDSLNIIKTTRDALDYSYSDDAALGNYKPLNSYVFDGSGSTLIKDTSANDYGLLGRQDFPINTDAEIVGHLAVKLYVDNTDSVNNQNVTAADVKSSIYVTEAKNTFAMNSLARYLGALGELTDTAVTKIGYDGRIYSWDSAKGTASKWYDSETSLVSSVVSVNDSTPEFTLLGSNDGSFTFTFSDIRPKDTEINTAIDNYEAHITP